MASSKWSKDDDATNCCICTDFFKSPKTLPCLHTFCLECLEKYAEDKDPGDTDTCPICRREFSIPQGGIALLPTNLFIEKLVEIKKLASNRQLVCDLCKDEDSAAKLAEWFCFNCAEKMCKSCSIGHRNSRITKQHKIIEIGDQQLSYLLQSRPSFCDEHPDKPLDFYCDDCRKAICMYCCLTRHVRPSHNTQDINEVSDKLRHQVQCDMEKVLEELRKCQQEAEKSKDGKNKLSADNALNNQMVLNKKDELIQLVEQDANILIQQLNNLNVKGIKKNGTNREDIDKQLLVWSGFARYCQEVIDKATPSEVARLADDLHTRAKELQDMTLIHAIPSSPIEFFPSDIVNSLSEDEHNIVGVIRADQEDRTGLFTCKKNSRLSAFKLSTRENTHIVVWNAEILLFKITLVSDER